MPHNRGIAAACSMLALAFSLPPLLPSDRELACRSLHGSESPLKVHGRLYAANGGGSGFRIWIVGTKRIVWLSAKIEPAVPDDIRNAFKPFDEQLYGDFTLVPLAPDRPGVMREVCFVSGEHLVARAAMEKSVAE